MAIWQSLKTFLDVTSGIVIVLVGSLLVARMLGYNIARSPERPTKSAVERMAGIRIDPGKIANVRGTGSAAIVSFSDFECPVCRRFALRTLPALLSTYVDTGTTRYVSFQYPLEEIHPRALRAAEAVECAARQNMYWEMHNRLFAQVEDAALVDLPVHAAAIKLDRNRFAACLSGEALDRVRIHQAEGRRLGVTGTPTFFLGTVAGDGSIDVVTRINGAASLETFATELKSLTRLAESPSQNR